MLSLITTTLLSIVSIFFILPWLILVLIPVLTVLGGIAYCIYSVNKYYIPNKFIHKRSKVKASMYPFSEHIYYYENNRIVIPNENKIDNRKPKQINLSSHKSYSNQNRKSHHRRL